VGSVPAASGRRLVLPHALKFFDQFIGIGICHTGVYKSVLECFCRGFWVNPMKQVEIHDWIIYQSVKDNVSISIIFDFEFIQPRLVIFGKLIVTHPSAPAHAFHCFQLASNSALASSSVATWFDVRMLPGLLGACSAQNQRSRRLLS
jgi:hypothetical protein